jgi:hypothetical protein
MNTRVGRAVLLATFGSLTPSLSGCSLLFVDTAPPNHAQLEHFDCTSGKAAPIIDTIVGAYQVVRTGYALSAEESDYDGYPLSRGADIGFGVGLTALFLGSAIYGYSETGACADAEAALAARRTDQAPVTVTPTGATAGCSNDAQCKGDRICEQGQCVAPPAPPAPPEAAPAPSAPAPEAPVPAAPSEASPPPAAPTP